MAHKAETQLMANLPLLRLAPQTPPFHYNACDYFGPFQYLNTTAVHLEMVVNLTTMEFIQVLRRFFSIRRYPAGLLSDNRSQMVDAAQELREMVQGLDSDQLRIYCTERRIHWMVTTPAAPQQKGCAEALKSCKRALRK